MIDIRMRFYCSGDYNRLSPATLKTFAINVQNNILEHYNKFTMQQKYHFSEYNAEVLDNFKMAYAYYFIEQTKESKKEFDKAKKKLLFLLDEVAAYINNISNGDASIIKLAGFNPTIKVPKRIKTGTYKI